MIFRNEGTRVALRIAHAQCTCVREKSQALFLHNLDTGLIFLSATGKLSQS